mmetsp:Transcript_4776/g.8191  ORF Transcript_4776/g.8191 Transcript_4776/m.8191 type:complete len:248 (-) Transcript_4776:380-1123(-)
MVSYSSTGVPIVQNNEVNEQQVVGRQQKSVKSWSKCLLIYGYVLVGLGAVNIISNLFMMFGVDYVSHIVMYDNHGRFINFQFDQRGLIFFALTKIVGGLVMIYQGLQQSKTTKPVLLEYKNAEAGVTQGISMTVRASKSYERLIHIVKILTLVQIVGGVFVIPYASLWFTDQSDNFLDYYFDEVIANQNTTSYQNETEVAGSSSQEGNSSSLNLTLLDAAVPQEEAQTELYRRDHHKKHSFGKRDPK